MRTIVVRRLMPMGWAVRYLYEGLSSYCTSKSRAAVLLETPPLPYGHEFSFQYGLLRLLRPRLGSCRDYLMRADRQTEQHTHAARDIDLG